MREWYEYGGAQACGIRIWGTDTGIAECVLQKRDHPWHCVPRVVEEYCDDVQFIIIDQGVDKTVIHS
jgi:hypothetical protein